jgi:phage terminase small subunit
MPARKPKSLITRHETNAEKAARAAHEAQFRSGKGLPMDAPARLAGHAVAEAAWRRLMREYGSVEGEIVTRMDLDILVDYCILLEQVTELDALRRDAYLIWQILNKSWTQTQEELEAKERFAYVDKLDQSLDNLVKLDTRADRKRSLLLQLRQSLYLTPRARAGVAPKQLEPEEPQDDMEALLNDIENELNTGHVQ